MMTQLMPTSPSAMPAPREYHRKKAISIPEGPWQVNVWIIEERKSDVGHESA